MSSFRGNETYQTEKPAILLSNMRRLQPAPSLNKAYHRSEVQTLFHVGSLVCTVSLCIDEASGSRVS